MPKLLKRIFMLTLIFTFVFSLSACDYEYYLYHKNMRKGAKVICVELINYINPDVQSSPLGTFPIDFEKVEVLETLNTNNIENFLDELSKTGRISNKPKHVIKSPHGQGIRMMYDDNGFSLITVTVINGKESVFAGHYDADANIERYLGISWQDMIDDFKALVNEFFITQI